MYPVARATPSQLNLNVNQTAGWAIKMAKICWTAEKEDGRTAGSNLHLINSQSTTLIRKTKSFLSLFTCLKCALLLSKKKKKTLVKRGIPEEKLSKVLRKTSVETTSLAAAATFCFLASIFRTQCIPKVRHQLRPQQFAIICWLNHLIAFFCTRWLNFPAQPQPRAKAKVLGVSLRSGNSAGKSS